MNKQTLIDWHERALQRAVAKNKRTLEKVTPENSNAYILTWQRDEIELHKDAITFLEQLP